MDNNTMKAEETFAERFLQNVTICRTAQGLTAQELSEKCGFGPRRIGNVESGKGSFSLSDALKICEALGHNVHDMTSGFAEVQFKHY